MSTRIVPGAEPFRFEGGPDGALLLHGFTGSPASMRPFDSQILWRQRAQVVSHFDG